MVGLQPGPAYITRRAGGTCLTGSQSITSKEKKEAEIFLEYHKNDQDGLRVRTAH